MSEAVTDNIKLPPMPAPFMKASEGYCCGNYSTGAEYMGSVETVCCGQLEERWPDLYSPEQVDALMREAVRLNAAPVTDEREAFETWGRSIGWNYRDLERSPALREKYGWKTQQTAWEAWQARAALAAAPEPQGVPEKPRDSACCENWAAGTSCFADPRTDCPRIATAKPQGVPEPAELLSLLQRARLYTSGDSVHVSRTPFAVFRSELDAAIAALEKS